MTRTRSFIGPCVVVAVEHGHGAPLTEQVERAAYTSFEYTTFPHLVIGNCQACSGVLIGGLPHGFQRKTANSRSVRPVAPSQGWDSNP